MARAAIICLALIATFCAVNAQTAAQAAKTTATTPAPPKAAATPAPVAPAKASAAAAPAAEDTPAPAAATTAAAPAAAPAAAGAAGAKSTGLDKSLQDAISRAAQMAAEDVIARGGTQAQANAAGAKAAQKVQASAKDGKVLPTGVNVTPTVQQKINQASEKAAREVVARGGTQAQANAAGEKAAKAILQQYQFSG